MVIYLDTSVLLADVLGERARPDPAIFEQPLASSRLLQYETRTRLHALGASEVTLGAADERLALVDMVELASVVLNRVLEPFPMRLRTLDAMHMATMLYLRTRESDVRACTYDARFAEACRALGIDVLDPADPMD